MFQQFLLRAADGLPDGEQDEAHIITHEGIDLFVSGTTVSPRWVFVSLVGFLCVVDTRATFWFLSSPTE